MGDAHQGDARVGDSGKDTGPVCVAPDTECPNGCVNLTNDPANCSACGHACGTGLVCSMGACSPNCTAPQVKCGVPDGGLPDSGTKPDAGDAGPVGHDGGDLADGGVNPDVPYCADPNTDPLNCGACGNVCPHGANSTAVCSAGTCSLTCAAGYGNCDSNPANGCETNVTNNPMSCGGCGIACDVPNATPSCVSGTCAIGMCNMGYADCDGKAQNGCEVNTDTTNNCGG
jgi:hypothetical protein